MVFLKVPIVSYRKIKGKIYANIMVKHGQWELLSAEFRSIKQVKDVTRDCKYQFCTPEAAKILKF